MIGHRSQAQRGFLQRLAKGGVSVNGGGDILGPKAGFDGDGKGGGQFRHARPGGLDAEDDMIGGAGHDAHEPFRVAQREGTAVGAELEGARFCIRRLGWQQAGGDDLGIGEADGGDAGLVPAFRMPGQEVGHQFALRHGTMGQHRARRHVADGIDPAHGGAALVVDLEEGAILAEAQFLDAQAVEVGRAADGDEGLVGGEAIIDDGLAFSVDLRPDAGNLVGYRAKPHTGVIDLDRIGAYEPAEFWEDVRADSGRIILDPGAFYILVSREAVHIPPAYAAEMAPYLAMVGEFRVHYAGFFDPGFGHDAAGGAGSRGVLEVRCHEAPFVLEHGQVVGRLVYEKMDQVPDQLYGAGIASNYQGQGLKLSKHFRA